MKTSSILASALLGALAIAAPVDKRALVTKTELVIETQIIYTTIWEGEAPPTEATPTPQEFYEQPASSQAQLPSTTPAYTPAYTPPAQEPSSVYTPPPVETPSPEPTPTPTPEPEPSTPAYTPSPVSEAAAVQSSSAPASGGSSSDGKKVYTGDFTIHEYGPQGSLGACGATIKETDYKVAVSSTVSGPNTWDAQTGDSTNPFCGLPITIEYEGETVNAVIGDMCMGGCGDAGLDVSKAIWDDLTGGISPTRLQLKWWANN